MVSRRSINSQRGAPVLSLEHTGTTHVCGWCAEALGDSANRSTLSDTCFVGPVHLFRTVMTGAPISSTKLRMMRSTGLPVTRATSVQKSFPAAFPYENFFKYDTTPRRNDSGPTYDSTILKTAAVF